MRLYRFMEIDTCPICGKEIWPSDKTYIGKPLETIPANAVFTFMCVDEKGTQTCGEFRISRVDAASAEDNWKAEYILIGKDFR